MRIRRFVRHPERIEPFQGLKMCENGKTRFKNRFKALFFGDNLLGLRELLDSKKKVSKTQFKWNKEATKHLK